MGFKEGGSLQFLDVHLFPEDIEILCNKFTMS